MSFLGGKKSADKNQKSNLGKPDQNEDLYSPALKLYGDTRASDLISKQNAWRVAYGCIVLSILLAFGLISASHQPKLVPVVVRIDSHGEASMMGIPPRLDQDPNLMRFAAQYQLRQFIQSSRSVTFDSDFQTKMITDYVKPFLTTQGTAQNLVNDFYKTNNPFETAKQGKSISVEVSEPIPQTPTTYELHWFETTKTSQGITVGRQEWKGFATIEIDQITSEQIRLNPLGIYVKDLSWQQIGSSTGQ